MEKHIRTITLRLVDQIRYYLAGNTSQDHQAGTNQGSNYDQATINKHQVVFNKSSFSTSASNIHGWLDWFFDRSPLSTAITATTLGFFVFIGGLFIATSISFEVDYLTTIPIYLGSFGIALVSGTINYASKQIHISYEKLRPCFLVDDKVYKKTITSWLLNIWKPSENWLAFTFLFTLSLAAVSVTFYYPYILNNSILSSLKPPLFRDEWFNGSHTNIKALIIIYYGVFISYLLGPSLRMLVRNFLFLRDLQKFPVIPIANIIRSRFQDIKSFYVRVSFAWFIGVGLFGFVFFYKLDILSVAFLSGLSIIGLVTFLTPHIIFRGYLENSHKLACDIALISLHTDIGINLHEDHAIINDIDLEVNLNKLGQDLKDLSGIMLATSLPKPFIYDTRDALILVVGQLIAFARLLIEVYNRAGETNIPATTYCLPLY